MTAHIGPHVPTGNRDPLAEMAEICGQSPTDRRYRKAVQDFPAIARSGLSRTRAIGLAARARSKAPRVRQRALRDIAAYARGVTP